MHVTKVAGEMQVMTLTSEGKPVNARKCRRAAVTGTADAGHGCASLRAPLPRSSLHAHSISYSCFPMDQNEAVMSDDEDNDWTTDAGETSTSEDGESDWSDEVESARTALASCPPGHPDRAEHVAELGYHLYMRHCETGETSLIDEAIELEREALVLQPPGHPNRAIRCANLAFSLHARHQQARNVALLDEAIELEREALALHPPGHRDRARLCTNLGSSLESFYEETSDIKLLDEAINLRREALALRPAGHSNRADSCASLGVSLHMRYEQTGDVALLDEAIELGREALAVRPPGYPNRAVMCANLGLSLHVRYEQTGDIALLDDAIKLNREALVLRPPGHPDRAYSCVNLGFLQSVRYDQTGDVALLDDAIKFNREALELLPAADQTYSCANLGTLLCTRYELTGDVALLDEAIKLNREALVLRPPGHPNRANSCANLGSLLYVHYEETGDVELLDEAIEFRREALVLRPLGHPDRADSCAGLAASLYMRYQQTSNVALLDEAIGLGREALVLHPPGQPDRANSCANLAALLQARYEQTGDAAVLDEAIEACRYASEHTPAAQVWRPLTQLSVLYLCNSPKSSVSKALEYLQQSFQHEAGRTSAFISAVCANATLMWDNSSVWTPRITTLLVDVYARLVDRLPLMAGFVLDTSSRLRTLKATHRVGSDACMAALLAEQPATALTLLDRAHGLVWSQALHQGDPQMEGAPKDLAIELKGLLRAIAVPMSADPAESADRLQDLRHSQNTRIYTILREIRAIPGLERFLLGSTYETLREAACDHPVVIFVAARGHAFALIMRSANENEPHALCLDLTSDDLLSLRGSAERAGLRSRADTRDGYTDARLLGISKTDVNHQPLRVLADIWRKIVKPVIDYLQLEVCCDWILCFPWLTLVKQKATGQLRPRLHWCTNGDFVFLPIHAAGIYTGPQANQACCSDFIVSSYIPTISALLRAQKSAAPIISENVNMLLVGEDCATNLNMGQLWNVQTELACIESIARTKQFGHTVESIPKEATVELVADRIKSASFLHLACHGIQHQTNALESGFYLRDDMLTISKLMDLKLDQPWFAYLSACETAKGDAEQPDQVMHLAAAMLFAGFKSVVATMWLVKHL
jgi:hypothetical protein